MSRPKKYKNDAEKHAAFRKRKKAAAAAAVPKEEPAILRHLLWLRDEITLRVTDLGLVSQRQGKRRRIFPPDPSTPGYGSLGVKLFNLLVFIERELDKTGVLADRGLRSGDAPRGLIPHLEHFRDQITRGRAAAGVHHRLPAFGGSSYDVLLEKLIDLLNLILKELDQAESWPIKA